MTREELSGLIRRKAVAYGSLRQYAAAHGVHLSTLSNMLHGRNRYTLRVLRLLGLDHVQVVARVTVEPVQDAPIRPYRRMWSLGDWPSRYRVTEGA